MSLHKSKQKSLSPKKSSSPSNHLDQIEPNSPLHKHFLSQYLTRKFIQQKHLNGYQKQIFRRQQLENQRLIRKLSQIRRRKSLHLPPQQDLHNKLYSLNINSRNFQRQKRERTLQQQNDIIVERIVRKRSYNNPYPSVTPDLAYTVSPQKRAASQSVLLPPIDEQLTST